MSVEVSKDRLRFGVFLCFLVLVFSGVLKAAETATGSIIGFVYDKDGTTPLEGAIVQFKNLSNDRFFASSRSDKYGIFKLQGIESGVYIYGVETPQGNFNSEGFVAVKINANETAKMAISLNPYDVDEAKAVSAVFKEQEIAGESLVGAITNFSPSSLIADVQVTKGLLRVNDKIHAKGRVTNFYQELNSLSKGGSPAKKALAGENAKIKLNQKAQEGDLVYVVKKRELLPLFLAPVGLALLVAGSSAIQGGIKVNEVIKPASDFKR
jgi:hypothetical protein